MAYQWYSGLLGPLGRRDEALELIKKAAELDPRSPIVLALVGVSYAALGRVDEALVWLRKSIEIDPDFAIGYNWIGFHYWNDKGKLDEAVRWFRKSVSVDPGNPDYITNLVSLFLDLGDLDRAEYWSERSIKLAPESFFSNIAMEPFSSVSRRSVHSAGIRSKGIRDRRSLGRGAPFIRAGSSS